MISLRSAAEILRELVAIPTPSSVSNLPLLRWVAEFLGRRGWQSKLFSYDDEAGVPKANLIAWPGAGELPEQIDLAFICHTDTVPYKADWTAALKLEERDGQLHGCGSCDVKGSLACFLAAVSGVDASAIRERVALILTADEEIGCKGMERLLTETKLRIGAAIVSEPTSLRAGVAGKGYGLARIVVHGREAHSAFPGQGVSAISVAARLITRIEDAMNRSDVRTDTLFDPPRTTVNVGVIEGGTAKNILAGRCLFLVEWRPVPGEDPAAMLGRLRELVDEMSKAQPRAEIELIALRAEPGFAPAKAGSLQGQLAGLLNSEPTGICFGSEASRVARVADEVIVIGPGDMRTAHSERECVPRDELEAWTRALVRVVTDRSPEQ